MKPTDQETRYKTAEERALRDLENDILSLTAPQSSFREQSVAEEVQPSGNQASTPLSVSDNEIFRTTPSFSETVGIYTGGPIDDGAIAGNHQIDDNDDDGLPEPGAEAIPGIRRSSPPPSSIDDSDGDNNEQLPIAAQVVNEEADREAYFMQRLREMLQEAIPVEGVISESKVSQFVSRYWKRVLLVALLVFAVVLPPAIVCQKPGYCGNPPDPEETEIPQPTETPTLAPTTLPGPWTWQQIGKGLEGNDEFHYFGTSVDITSDGTYMAVGSDSREGASYAEAYRLQVDAKTWVLVANRIPRPLTSPRGVAEKIFLGDDKTTLSIFEVDLLQVHILDGTSWELRQKYNASNATIRKGGSVPAESIAAILSVHVSSDATHVALCFKTESGTFLIQVFETTSGFPRGWPLLIGIRKWPLRNAFAIANQGNVIAVGGAGFVTICEYGTGDDRFDWNRPGTKISTTSDNSTFFGSEVQISSDGRTVAVEGLSKIFVFRSDQDRNWNQVGDPIDVGKTQMLPSGSDMLIFGDGNTLCIREQSTAFLNPGTWLRTLLFDGDKWNELDVIDEPESDELVCALSDDGMSLCCGSPNYFETGSDIGIVKTYRLVRKNSVPNDSAPNTASPAPTSSPTNPAV